MSKKCCCCAERAPADDPLRWPLHCASRGQRGEAEAAILRQYLLADENGRGDLFIRLLAEMLDRVSGAHAPDPKKRAAKTTPPQGEVATSPASQQPSHGGPDAP